MALTGCIICNQKEGASPYLDYKKSPTISGDLCVRAFTEKKIYKCDSCESCFIYPNVNEKELDNFYSALYSKLPQKLSLLQNYFPYQNSRYLSQVIFLKSFLNTNRNINVLEIGSNITSILPALSFLSERIKFLYFDQIESPIIKKYGGKRVGAFADPESMQKLIKKDKLDLIHMSHTLEHISPSNLASMLQQCWRTLKYEGYIFIEVPFQLEMENFYPPHTLFFSTDGLSSLFKRLGFKIINLELVNETTSRTENKNIESERISSIIQKINFLKSRIYGFFMIILVQIPWVNNVFKKLHFLSCIRKLQTPYDRRPFIRLIAQKSSN